MKLDSILLLIFLILFLSYKKEKLQNITEAKNNDGTGLALINNNQFASTITDAIRSDKEAMVNINMQLYLDHIERQSFSLVNIPLKVGKHKVVSSRIVIAENTYRTRNDDSCIATFYLGEDDVLENSYYILESAPDNYIQVEEYEVSKPFVKGSFNLTLYRRDPKTRPQTQGFPDTLRVTDGKFEVTIK